MAPTVEERLRRRTEQSVRRYIDDHDVWPPDGGLVVALSGGPDSTALLFIMRALRPDLRLVAAYFDHRLRGEEASRVEREAVARVAERAGAELVCGVGDVRALARDERLSLEEAARRARYAFLGDVAVRTGCRRVAAGHTASDQAETVLMHILRGSGLTGLAGIRPRSRWPAPGRPELTLVRPMLALTREETEAYCRSAGVQPIEDASNRSKAYLRNRVRHDLLPELRRYNPRVDAALTRLAEAARAGVEAIEQAPTTTLESRDGSVLLDRRRLRPSREAVRLQALQSAVLALVGDLQGFGERHWKDLDRAAVSGRTGSSVDLPRGAEAVVGRETVELRLKGGVRPEVLPPEAVSFTVPGKARFGPWTVSAGEKPLPGAVAQTLVSAEAVGGELTVRRRRPGDRFQPSGMEAEKKLQDFLVDAHVSREERDRVLLFEARPGIAWVAGPALGLGRVSEWARAREGEAVVVLSYRRAEA